MPSQHRNVRQRRTESLGGSAWGDLHRTIMIALPRSTESELVELLSANLGDAEDLGRLAGWRLWRLINDRRDKHHYRPRHGDRLQADHVTEWDDATPAERRRILARSASPAQEADRRAEFLRKQEAQREEAHRREAALAAAEAERAEKFARWNLARYTQPQAQQPAPETAGAQDRATPTAGHRRITARRRR